MQVASIKSITKLPNGVKLTLGKNWVLKECFGSPKASFFTIILAKPVYIKGGLIRSIVGKTSKCSKGGGLKILGEGSSTGRLSGRTSK